MIDHDADDFNSPEDLHRAIDANQTVDPVALADQAITQAFGEFEAAIREAETGERLRWLESQLAGYITRFSALEQTAWRAWRYRDELKRGA